MWFTSAELLMQYNFETAQHEYSQAQRNEKGQNKNTKLKS